MSTNPATGSAVTPPLPLAVVGLRFGAQAIDWIQNRYHSQAVRPALVCDLDTSLAEKVGTRLGVPWTNNIADVLASSITAVALFTPPNGRAKLLTQLLQAGKDVMATKPFELDSVSAREVLSLASRLGRIIHLNSPSPGGAPDLRCINRWRECHQLGRPVALRADAMASYSEQRDGSWYDDPMKCPAAPVFRMGIYLINDALTLLGPVEQAFVTTSHLRTGRPTPDQAMLSLRHAGGALTCITASFCVDDGASWRNSLTLNFEHGTIYRNAGPDHSPDGADLSLAVNRNGRRMVIERAHVAPVWSGEYNWNEFAQAVRARSILSAEDARLIVDGIRVVEAMGESERSGTPVRVPALIS